MTVQAEYVQAVRCPCGAIIYVTESEGEATCGRCNHRFRWNTGRVDLSPSNTALQSGVPSAPPRQTSFRFPFWTLYRVGFWITAVVTFFCCWIYTIVASGFIVGVLIGWLPSLIAAAVIGALWPVIVVGIVVTAYLFSR